MNVLTVSGNLGKDCRLNQTGSGTQVAGFSVAVKSGYGDSEQTVWVNCSLFGKRAESLAPYLVKSQQVVVSGEMGTREHEGKTYVTLKANDVTLVGGKPANAQTSPMPAVGSQQQQQGGFNQQPQGANQQPQGVNHPAPQQGFPAPIDNFDQDVPF